MNIYVSCEARCEGFFCPDSYRRIFLWENIFPARSHKNEGIDMKNLQSYKCPEPSSPFAVYTLLPQSFENTRVESSFIYAFYLFRLCFFCAKKKHKNCNWLKTPRFLILRYAWVNFQTFKLAKFSWFEYLDICLCKKTEKPKMYFPVKCKDGNYLSCVRTLEQKKWFMLSLVGCGSMDCIRT